MHESKNKIIKREYDEPVNKGIKKEIKEEILEDSEVQNTLEQNIDTAIKTRSLGLAGR